MLLFSYVTGVFSRGETGREQYFVPITHLIRAKHAHGPPGEVLATAWATTLGSLFLRPYMLNVGLLCHK